MKIALSQILVLSAALIAGLSNAAVAQENGASSQCSGVYENKEAGFTIACPKGWYKQETEDKSIKRLDVTFSLLPVTQDFKSQVIIALSCHSAPVSFDLEHPLDAVNFGGMKGLLRYSQDSFKREQSMKDDRQITVIQEPVEIEQNKVKGVWWAIDSFSPSSPLRRLVRVTNYDFLKKGKWVTILCVAGKDDYLAHEKEIKTTVNSFTFN